MSFVRRLFLVTVLALAAAAVAQGALTSNADIPSSFTFVDPCSGEAVAVTGVVHVVTTSTTSDNTVSGTFHSNFKATGIGLLSGLQYQESAVATGSFNTSLVNEQATNTFVGRINVVAQGAQNNYSSPIFMHTTMNASGEVTALKLEAPTIVCH